MFLRFLSILALLQAAQCQAIAQNNSSAIDTQPRASLESFTDNTMEVFPTQSPSSRPVVFSMQSQSPAVSPMPSPFPADFPTQSPSSADSPMQSSSSADSPMQSASPAVSSMQAPSSQDSQMLSPSSAASPMQSPSPAVSPTLSPAISEVPAIGNTTWETIDSSSETMTAKTLSTEWPGSVETIAASTENATTSKPRVLPSENSTVSTTTEDIASGNVTLSSIPSVSPTNSTLVPNPLVPFSDRATPSPTLTNQTVVASLDHMVSLTFQYNCSLTEIAAYEKTMLEAIASQNASISSIQVQPVCFSTIRMNVSYDKETLLEELEHKEVIMLTLLNRTYYVTITGHDPNHSAFSLTKRELYIFIPVAIIIGVLLILGIVICGVKCCCKKKKSSATSNLYADRSQYTDAMALTRIPRPSTYASPRDEGLVQPFDTSVVPLEDGQKLDDIQRYRRGPEVTMRTFDSRKRVWHPETNEHLRNGVENPTYAKF